LYQAMGKYSQAVALQTRCNEAMEKDFIRTLASGSERNRLYLLNLTSRYLNFTLTLHTQFSPADLPARQMALRVLLQRKGGPLDATTDTIAASRRHVSAEDQKLPDQRAEARSKMANTAVKGANKDDLTKHRGNLELLEQQAEGLEYELSRRSAEFRAQSV